MYLWWSLCTLYLHACQVRVTVGDSGLCCCACDTYFERQLSPLCVESAKTAYRQLRISSIRHCLSVDSTKTLVMFFCYVTAGFLQRNPSSLLVMKTRTRFSSSAYALLASNLSKNQLQTFLHLFLLLMGRVFNTLLTSSRLMFLPYSFVPPLTPVRFKPLLSKPSHLANALLHTKVLQSATNSRTTSGMLLPQPLSKLL